MTERFSGKSAASQHARTGAIELGQLDSPAEQQLTRQPEPLAETPPPEFSLPKADGGRDAWLVLAACFVLEALVWGK